jgi:hypothetical protein
VSFSFVSWSMKSFKRSTSFRTLVLEMSFIVSLRSCPWVSRQVSNVLCAHNSTRVLHLIPLGRTHVKLADMYYETSFLEDEKVEALKAMEVINIIIIFIWIVTFRIYKQCRNTKSHKGLNLIDRMFNLSVLTRSILYIKAIVVSVCVGCVGSAWKILPVTTHSLWSFPRCNWL